MHQSSNTTQNTATQLRFAQHWSRCIKSCCSSLHLYYTHSSPQVQLTHSKALKIIQMGLLCLELVPETAKNTPHLDLFSVACFNLAKTMTYIYILTWLTSIFEPTPPYKDVSSTLRDHESHIWGQWGHHQVPEAT